MEQRSDRFVFILALIVAGILYAFVYYSFLVAE